tara:strand:- start:444 stop:1184 length:741 start_codon:yes stop_codon:yes gene_type:complete
MRNFRFKNFMVYIHTLVGIVQYAKNPFLILYCYLIRKAPKEMKTKNGLTIMPSNPHDIVTFVVVFCKKDYGEIAPGSVVVDVGANIGIFSLYALAQGAIFVECFEPCKESFQMLKENIKLNGFDKYVKLHNKAVSSKDGLFVWIPISSSPYNAVTEAEGNEENKFEKIETVSLETSLDSYAKINLIKIDCEGAEFDIFPSLTPLFLDKIDEIRMELHGTIEQLEKCFSYQPFKIISKGGNDFWLIK